MMHKQAPAGSLTRQDFEAAFTNAPALTSVYTPKTFEKRLSTYIELCKDTDRDYRMLNKILVEIRSVIEYESSARELLLTGSNVLFEVLLLAIKDKRSAVQHEGTFTVAMLVKTFGHDVLNFAAEALAALIPFSQNSIKVVSSGATVTASYICQHIRSPKVLNTLIEFMKTSKSRFVRGAVMDMVREVAEYWPIEVIKKNTPKLRELIDLGNADAGPTAREATRETLTLLNSKVPEVFQPPQAARAIGRPNNFYASRAATDLSTRMLSAKRNGIAETRLPFRTKQATPNGYGNGTTATVTMRSRTPTANSSRAISQPGSRQGSPTRQLGALASRPTSPTRQTPVAAHIRPTLAARTVSPTRQTSIAYNGRPTLAGRPASPTHPTQLSFNGRPASPPTHQLASAIKSASIMNRPTTPAREGTTNVVKLVEIITSNADVKARCSALHSLKELANHSHAVSINCSMLINRLIDVQLGTTELALVKAVEDCTQAFARNVDVKILLPVLKNIVRAPEQPERKSAAAIRMLSHLVLQQSEAEARDLVDSVVPLVFKMYERGTQSAVRRECVICLVVFTNKVSPAAVEPYVTPQMQKLISVYGNRQNMSVWRPM